MSEDDSNGLPPQEPGTGQPPAGGVYDWYVRGMSLLEGGSPEAAAQLLERAHHEEPASNSIREAFARALFDARRYPAAVEQFAELAEREPDNDYARFGLGLTRFRLGEFEAAVSHLSMAVAMRPGRPEYVRALREAQATVKAREQS
ncbi:tetratricopeptide repeat protein [Motilibacter aurantiacus]|uniref:tetratricopeptide repeat protein n=1 Tax=Motilibacter aurantiacus TaxID=2714955 RepID=UPI0014087C24|nr:tetratricopeptide repeat protein [Motilibacter aurantiacus]NHC47083.1 tetratricopeptide repeat protein [Motilibacter aurantiacus]